jgi:hypothetical protein
LTVDQKHTDQISNGQVVSRHTSPSFLYFLFSQPHIYLIQYYFHRTNDKFGFVGNTSRLYAKPSEPFFANALDIITENIILKLASFQKLLLKSEKEKS